MADMNKITRRIFLKLFACVGFLFLTNRLYANAVKRPVPKTVDELYAAMNNVIAPGRSTIIQWSVTGEDYIEYAFGTRAVVKNQEALLCKWHWNTFISNFMKIKNPYMARLYWSVKPEFRIEKHDPWFDGGDLSMIDPEQLTVKQSGRFYARYLISSEPVLSYNGDPAHDERVSFIRRHHA